MFKPVFSILLTVLVATNLAACGGSDEPCAGTGTQSFGVDFPSRSYTLKVGQAATLQSNVIPESCRSSMGFRVFSGSLPTSMILSGGNIVGTPTAVGTFQFQIAVTAIEGYAAVNSVSPPRSSGITVSVTQ
jgi:hypothetical protein